MSWLTLLAPIVLELLKIFFGGGSASEKEKAQKEILNYLQRIREAMKKAEETGGNTEDLEKIINRPK